MKIKDKQEIPYQRQQLDHEEQKFHNFKGIHEHDEEDKYIDPFTGAHFEYKDFYQRLKIFCITPEDDKYKRNNNSEYYSFDSNTVATDSRMLEGSAIVTTPAKNSDKSIEIDKQRPANPYDKERLKTNNEEKVLKPDYKPTIPKKIVEKLDIKKIEKKPMLANILK